jgi:hypothetical protein
MSPTIAAEPAHEVNRDEVASEAYRLSLNRHGAPDPVSDWFEAEAIVRARMADRRRQHAAAAERVITPAPEEIAVPPRAVSAAARAAAERAKAAKAAAAAKAAKETKGKTTSASAGRTSNNGRSSNSNKKSGKR